ncbi:MAG TPA: polymer-forming cytoskeletal protein [Candidatus Dormibacteraeota bacterium]
MEVQDQTEQVAEPAGEPENNEGRRNRRGGNNMTLGPRDSLVGKLTIDGDVRILGTVEGEVTASGDIDVESRANVRAALEGRNLSIRGEVTGDAVARERLTLAGSGTLNGNVKVARLAIEDGATLNGNVTMQKGEG